MAVVGRICGCGTTSRKHKAYHRNDAGLEILLPALEASSICLSNTNPHQATVLASWFCFQSSSFLTYIDKRFWIQMRCLSVYSMAPCTHSPLGSWYPLLGRSCSTQWKKRGGGSYCFKSPRHVKYTKLLLSSMLVVRFFLNLLLLGRAKENGCLMVKLPTSRKLHYHPSIPQLCFDDGVLRRLRYECRYEGLFHLVLAVLRSLTFLGARNPWRSSSQPPASS